MKRPCGPLLEIALSLYVLAHLSLLRMWSLPVLLRLILFCAPWEDALVFFQSWFSNDGKIPTCWNCAGQGTPPVGCVWPGGLPVAPLRFRAASPHVGDSARCHSEITLSQAERSPGPGNSGQSGPRKSGMFTAWCTLWKGRAPTSFTHGQISLWRLPPAHFWPTLKIINWT